MPALTSNIEPAAIGKRSAGVHPAGFLFNGRDMPRKYEIDKELGMRICPRCGEYDWVGTFYGKTECGKCRNKRASRNYKHQRESVCERSAAKGTRIVKAAGSL